MIKLDNWVNGIFRGLKSLGGMGAGRLAGKKSAEGSAENCIFLSLRPDARFNNRDPLFFKILKLWVPSLPRLFRRYSILNSHLDAIEGPFSSSVDRDKINFLAMENCWKSCAERPIFRALKSKENFVPIIRFSQILFFSFFGQIPSFNPANIKTSAL